MHYSFIVQMAGVVDKIKKKKAGNRDWSNSGSFINKPAKGWLHPDEQLAEMREFVMEFE